MFTFLYVAIAVSGPLTTSGTSDGNRIVTILDNRDPTSEGKHVDLVKPTVSGQSEDILIVISHNIAISLDNESQAEPTE